MDPTEIDIVFKMIRFLIVLSKCKSFSKDRRDLQEETHSPNSAHRTVDKLDFPVRERGR